MVYYSIKHSFQSCASEQYFYNHYLSKNIYIYQSVNFWYEQCKMRICLVTTLISISSFPESNFESFIIFNCFFDLVKLYTFIPILFLKKIFQWQFTLLNLRTINCTHLKYNQDTEHFHHLWYILHASLRLCIVPSNPFPRKTLNYYQYISVFIVLNFILLK